MTLNTCQIKATMKYFSLLLTILLLFACDSKSKVEQEIEEIPVEFDIMRFDKEFDATTPETLASIKQKYPVFFPRQFHDSVWIARINDTLQQQLNDEVQAIFPSEEKLEDVLHPLFQHIKYYIPQFEVPTVVTTTSDVDYQNKVIVADTLLVLGLDTYLGSEHPFYVDINRYIAKNLKEEQLGPDVASAYARQLIAKPRQRSFLAQIIYFGKELYLKDLWLPEATDAAKIGYNEEEMQWAQDNETEIWRNFVENEILYSTNPKLGARFIAPAPFSKFYLEIDNESPGMIGRFVGWQIVRAYMENNDTSVEELLRTPADVIFKQSKYKPKR